MKNHLRAGGVLAAVFCASCATAPQHDVDAHAGPSTVRAEDAAPRESVTPPATTADEVAAAAPVADERVQTPPLKPDTSQEQKTTPAARDQLAVLRVEAGALITQVNGDPNIRCTRPDCTIPLPPGTHRFTVGYKSTATRAGSTVTYASMYPRVVQVTLEPGHHYSITASGRYSQKWWVAIEDQTANKVVYDDRVKRP